MKDQRRLFLVLAFLNALWAPVNSVIRYATEGGFSPLALATVRWSCLTAVLCGCLRVPWYRDRTRAKPVDAKGVLVALVTGMLFFGPSHALYYYALQHTSTTEGTALGTTSPIWTATFAFVFLREKVGGRRFAALVVGLIGAYIVSIGFALPQVNAGHTYGNLIYLLATIMESAVTVIAAPIARRSSGITVLAWEVSGAAFALILISSLHLPGMEFAIKAPSLSGVLAISYLVLVAGMMCFAGWYMLVESAPVSLLVVSLMLQPPLAAIVGYFAFGEKITRDLVIGSVVILGALVLDAET